MYPGTVINKWIDKTVEPAQDLKTVDNKVLFLTACSFDKGPDDRMVRVSGDNFYKLFGYNNRFSKHGQAAIQAAKIIDAGGDLLVKRMVANDSALANIVFIATINTTVEVPPTEDIVPTESLSIPSQSTTWLNKPISDMISDDVVVSEDGTVHGTIKRTEFVEFNTTDVNEQSGYYFPFTLNTTGTTMTMKIGDRISKEDIPFDADIIFRVVDTSVKYEVIVDDVTAVSLDFSKAKMYDENTTDDTAEDTEVEVKSTTTLKWSAVFFENCYSFNQIKEEARKLFDPENGVYPLIVIADNGRGKSSKKVQISRNSEVSSSVGKQFFDINVYEGTTKTDTAVATLDSTIYNGVQYGLEEFTAVQIKFDVDQDIFESYKMALAEAMGVEESAIRNNDMINMMTIKGLKLDNIDVDPESIDMSVAYGVELGGGSDGEFGDIPVNSPALEEALVEFFSGNTDIDIYDLDEYKIGTILDACYPYSVKEAIAQLVTFREDCIFFRDMRTDADSYNTTVEVMKKFETNNKFISNYMTWYQIYDPATKRRIPVSMMYDLAECLVNEFDTGIHYPTAGIANGFILKSAIEGTVCYTPRKTPLINQKQMMDDIKVNYAIFQSGQCVVQSLYTTQKEFSQLSYVNNVLGIQEVVRSVRTSCPKKRYTFVDNQDFSEYSDAVNHVLKNFKSNFDYLSFKYYKDSLLAHHKIFYGAIEFAFKDWAQTEMFDIIAINNNEVVADE